MATKRVNPNRIKTHFSYTTRELADTLGVHKNTIRNWTRRGLSTLSKRPALYHGGTTRAFLTASNAERKRPCPPGMFYCFRCRDHRRPALAMVDFVECAGRAGNLTGLCETCGATMNRRARREAVAVIMPGLDVQIRREAPRLKGRIAPFLNCDTAKRGAT
jgi:hypothetical protein